MSREYELSTRMADQGEELEMEDRQLKNKEDDRLERIGKFCSVFAVMLECSWVQVDNNLRTFMYP